MQAPPNMTPKITLYYHQMCPYCWRVLEFMEKNSLEIPLRNTRTDDGARHALIKIGGKSQVPALILHEADGDRALYESEDIVAWMEKNLVSSSGSLHK